MRSKRFGLVALCLLTCAAFAPAQGELDRKAVVFGDAGYRPGDRIEAKLSTVERSVTGFAEEEVKTVGQGSLSMRLEQVVIEERRGVPTVLDVDLHDMAHTPYWEKRSDFGMSRGSRTRVGRKGTNAFRCDLRRKVDITRRDGGEVGATSIAFLLAGCIDEDRRRFVGLGQGGADLVKAKRVAFGKTLKLPTPLLLRLGFDPKEPDYGRKLKGGATLEFVREDDDGEVALFGLDLKYEHVYPATEEAREVRLSGTITGTIEIGVADRRIRNLTAHHVTRSSTEVLDAGHLRPFEGESSWEIRDVYVHGRVALPATEGATEGATKGATPTGPAPRADENETVEDAEEIDGAAGHRIDENHRLAPSLH